MPDQADPAVGGAAQFGGDGILHPAQPVDVVVGGVLDGADPHALTLGLAQHGQDHLPALVEGKRVFDGARLVGRADQHADGIGKAQGPAQHLNVCTMQWLETADENQRVETLGRGAHEAPSRDWRLRVCPSAVPAWYAARGRRVKSRFDQAARWPQLPAARGAAPSSPAGIAIGRRGSRSTFHMTIAAAMSNRASAANSGL